MAGEHNRGGPLAFSAQAAKPNSMQAFDGIVFRSS